MKIIVTIIPTDLVTNLLLSSFVLSYQPTPRIRFSASWWSGCKKYFCFLFTASNALLQSHTEFKRILWRNFLTYYFCSYYSSMVKVYIFLKFIQYTIHWDKTQMLKKASFGKTLQKVHHFFFCELQFITITTIIIHRN